MKPHRRVDRHPSEADSADASPSEGASRTFFRHLHDPGRLVQDPIVTAYYERTATYKNSERGAEQALDEIRATVLTIARRLRVSDAERVGRERAERRYQAIVRGDLGHELAKTIASDLGISIRQFRRERSCARTRIVRELLERDTPRSAEILPDAVALELDLARRLAESGRPETAIEILRSLGSANIPPARRVEALVALAEVFLDGDLAEEATAAAMAARELAPEASDVRSAVSRARVEFAVAMLQFRYGDTARALEREDAALAAGVAYAERDLDAATVVATILVERARRALSKGAWRSAGGDIERIRGLMSRCAGAAPIALIDSLILESHVALARSEDFSHARIASAHALQMAQREGFGRRAAVAGRHLAFAHYLMGGRDAAVATARAAVEVARQVGDRTVLASTALGAADLELMSGHADSAAPYLETATPNVSEGSLYWSQLHLRWADLYQQRGATNAALEHALLARNAAESLGNGRFLGAALRRCAQLQHELGNARTAARTMEAALDVLRRHSTRRGLALGYEISSRISGRQKAL
jgi:tetratricopeptide (TPR) repeat protein